MNPELSPVICTIAAPNYLAHARCLTESFLTQHPDGRVFVLLVDSGRAGLDPRGERFTPITVSELAIPDFAGMAFRYDVTELCTAVKPFFLEYLFERYRLERLIYFDPDIYFYQPITSIWSALEHAAVVLTPHMVNPVDDAEFGSERRILPVGVYNLGFIGLARKTQLSFLLKWWQKRLKDYCVAEPDRALFVDQRWADLMPAFFDNVLVLRSPVYNVAYWNVGQRRITRHGEQWRVNGQPLVFYHFSGIVVRDRGALSRHFQTAMPENASSLLRLLDDYRERLFENGFETVEQLSYSFGLFENGIPVPLIARHLWRNQEGAKYWPVPFRTASSDSFFNWLNQDETASVDSSLPLTNLALEVYRLHPEIHRKWPDPSGRDRGSFLHWFVDKGADQDHIDSAFIEPIQTRLLTTDVAEILAKPADSPAPRAEPMPGGHLASVRDILQRLGWARIIRRLLGKRLMYLLYDRRMIVRHPTSRATTNRFDT